MKMVNVKAHTRKTKKGTVIVKPHTRSFRYLGRNISVSPRQYARGALGTGFTEYLIAKDSFNITVDSSVWHENVKGKDVPRLINQIKDQITTEKNVEKLALESRNRYWNEQADIIIDRIKKGEGNMSDLQEKFFKITGRKIDNRGKISR